MNLTHSNIHGTKSPLKQIVDVTEELAVTITEELAVTAVTGQISGCKPAIAVGFSRLSCTLAM